MTILTVGKLSPARVRTAKPEPGRKALIIGDGGGLWLQCTRGAGGHIRRSWTFRYELDGKRREMGLGPLFTIGLAEAREKARTLRQQLLEGVDPLEARDAGRRAKIAAAAKAMPFKECARLYLELHAAGWGDRHREQWLGTLRDYINPVLGEISVAEIDEAGCLKVVEPIWRTHNVTAGRIRSRIEAVLDYASASGFRTGDNPARALLTVLPKQSKTHKVKHHIAVPWKEAPAVMAKLRKEQTPAGRCVEFIALTAARAGEAAGARWSEMDLNARVWTIPAERMKSKKEHRVPLAPRVVELLQALPRQRGNDQVFPKLGKTTALDLIQRIYPKATVHGFRSTFRDWCREATNFPDAIAEAALAHAPGSKVVQAYARGDLFDRRRKLMQMWAEYCTRPASKGGDVVSLDHRR